VARSTVLMHTSVPLCPHIIGYFRNDIPPEEHQIITAECEECGPVTATAPRPRIGRPGFGITADR
jgi:hypothetical protein